MRAKVQAEIKRDEIGESTQAQIQAYLHDYRHVTSIQCEDHIVKMGIDSDAIVGLVARKFDLEYTGRHHGTLHFGNWEPTQR